jgi:RHS repeat-associated protein
LGGNQSCSYVHDDLSRIESVDCGEAWAQTFSYDSFGNLSKSGSAPFQPTYGSNNRIISVGGTTPVYDPDGNSTNDTFHSYEYDAAGKPVQVDSVLLTNDALGRVVEQNRSGAYSQIVYAPGGGKLALMSGQSLQKAFVGLPGGSSAVYTSAGLAFYRHSDWLGSSRFASTPARTMYFDGAYAPFGEAYAQTGTTDLSFTGMNQDTVANLYDFPAREYGIQGRWPTPDAAGFSSVRMGDPQTWNRYAYVRNNPLAVTDPTGREDDDIDYETDDQTDTGDGGSGGGGGGGGGGPALDGGAGQNGTDPSQTDNNPPDVTDTTPPPDLCSIGICPAPLNFTYASDSVPSAVTIVSQTAVGPQAFVNYPNGYIYGAGDSITYQVVDQYGAVLPVAGLQPWEIDVGDGNQSYTGPTGPPTDTNGQYIDSPVGFTSPGEYSDYHFTQTQQIKPGSTQYCLQTCTVGTVNVTVEGQFSTSSSVEITGSNGIDVTYQPPDQ